MSTDITTSEDTETRLITMRERLANDAKEALEIETGGTKFFGLKNGILSWADVEIPNNEIVVIILASVFENAYYPNQYNSEKTTPPVCFAISKFEKELTPHENVKELGQEMAPSCGECPMNQYDTARNGPGKACKNSRRLAVITAGVMNETRLMLNEEKSAYDVANIGFIRIPVTSVKAYSDFTKKIAASKSLPTWAVVTRIKVLPDPKTSFRVEFTPLLELPNDMLLFMPDLVDAAAREISFGYEVESAEEEAPQKRARPSTSVKGKF